MKQLFLLLLCLCSSLHANYILTEGEPSSLIEGIASVITGDLYLSEEDIVIEGAEPLRIKRNYIGFGRQHVVFPHLFAEFIVPHRMIHITEPNGTSLSYVHHPLKEHKKKHKKDKHEKQHYIFDPIDLSQLPGASNTARGALSARTNIKNNRLNLDDDWEYLTVHCADGTQRRYRALPHQKRTKIKSGGFEMKMYLQYFYYLESEELPNGNKILYDWDDLTLRTVRTTNPSQTRTYAQASYEYLRKDEKHAPDYNVTTSDGRRLEYRHRQFGEKHQYILERITSSQFPDETLHYTERLKAPFLSEVHLPQGRRFFIERDEAHRVKELKAPVGKSDALITTHHFTYFPDQRRTDVRDSSGAVTRYFWSEEKRLIRIERYTKDQALYNVERFGWGGNGSRDAGNLLFRTLYDQDNKPLSSRSYRYDDRGNVEEETFWGNLSGNGTLETGTDGNPTSGETYKKRFQYNERNLIVREEDNGKASTYDHMPGTNLCTAQLIYEGTAIKRRHFTVYNGDRIPIRDIQDDGSSPDLNDVTSVKTRIIKDISLIDGGPYNNMPQSIEEKYWNGSGEVLLKKTVLHYTTGGSVSKQEIYDAHGVFCYAVSTQYDHKGRPIEESNALGQVAKSSYDEIGNKVFFKDFSGNTTLHMTYDHSNRLTRVEEKGEGLARVTEHAFDTRHNHIASTDFRGNTTSYIYDDFNHLIETHFPPVLDEAGAVVHPILRSVFDSAGREASSTDAKGNTTHTRYNAYGKPIEVMHPDGSTEKFTYNLNGTLKTYIDQVGTETSYTYDVFGRETSKCISSQNEVLAQETFVYDSFNLIKKIDAEGHETHYCYDGTGRKISEQLEDQPIGYGYDALGRVSFTQHATLLNVKEYDLLNRVICEKKQDLNGTVLFQEEYLYDAAGNQSAIIRFPHNQRAEDTSLYDPFNRLVEKINPLGYATITTYCDEHANTLGQRVLQKTTTDALGNSTIETYDVKERLICTQKTNAQGQRPSQEDYSYDANDNLVRQESTVLSAYAERHVTTRWVYDAMDRVSALQEACGEAEERTTHYTYTPKGLLAEKTKPDGTIIAHVYEPLGRCIEISSSDVHYRFQYNRIGQLIRSTDVLRQTSTEKQWDVHGQLLCETLANGLSLTSDYDGQGRRTALHLPDSTYVAYAYDPLFLRTVTRHRNEPCYAHYFTRYDLTGNLLEETHIDQSVSAYQIDFLGRKSAFAHPQYSQQVLEYDPVGNILVMRFPEEIVHYTYDDLYQLKSETGLFAHNYSYDSHFNRLSKDEETYCVNSLNQMPQFTYDANGNPLSDGTRCFSYDAFDRLIGIQDGEKRYVFTYDSEHRRLTKHIYERSSEIERVQFLYDGQNEIGSVDANGHWKDLRILGRTPSAEIGAAIAIELQGQTCVPIHDLQGNVCAILPVGGSPERYRYSAFGEERVSDAHCPWRFSSKRTDETHFVYYGRRYYSPLHGRWLTPDPQGFSAGINLYAFVSNDPLIKVDLYGLMEVFWDFKDANKDSLNQCIDDYKNTGKGIAYAGKDITANTAVALSYVGYGFSMPFRAPLWAMNRGSFSRDWQSFQASNEAFRNATERWMQRVLPADTNNSTFRFTRAFTGDLLETGGFVLGGAGIVMKGTALAYRGYTAMRAACGAKEIQWSHKLCMSELKEVGNFNITSQGISKGFNSFKNKTFDEIDKMLRLKGFSTKGPDPLNGKGSYFHPITNRKYYLDQGNRIYRNNIKENPHVDIFYKKPINGIEKKKFPLGESVYEEIK